MSSTARGAKRDPEDFYSTPAWVVRAVLPHLPPLRGLRIIEPSAGEGAILRELIAAGASPRRIVAVEPNAKRCARLEKLGVEVIRARFEVFAAKHTRRKFDLAIGNPPFKLAEPHVDLACGLLAPGGTVAMLLRLAFLAEGQARAEFRRRHPHDRLELARRPSFTAELLPRLRDADLAAMARKKKGKRRLETPAEVRARLARTDSCAYAWGLFGQGRGGQFLTHEESTAQDAAA